MTVKDFIEKYNDAKDKDTFINNHIVINYLPYEEKINLCNRVVQATCYKEVNDRRIFWLNTPAQFMLFTVAVIEAYTDIELSDNIINDFNDLDRENLSNKLMSSLPKPEYITLRDMINMMVDDIRENERELVSWIEGKRELFAELAVSILESLPETQESMGIKE